MIVIIIIIIVIIISLLGGYMGYRFYIRRSAIADMKTLQNSNHKSLITTCTGSQLPSVKFGQGCKSNMKMFCKHNPSNSMCTPYFNALNTHEIELKEACNKNPTNTKCNQLPSGGNPHNHVSKKHLMSKTYNHKKK